MDAPLLTPLAAAVLHVPAPERALLVGCGDGDAAFFLAREFPTARIRAVDRSAEAVGAAQARAGLDPEGRLVFKLASGRRLEFPAAHFDLIVLLDSWVAAGELARVLRAGGDLIVANTKPPAISSLWHTRRLHARLARRGFDVRREEDAGSGNFVIAHLEPRRRPPSGG